MAGLQEVPTDELLLFQDFPPIHNPNSFTSTDITIPISVDSQEKSTKPIEIFQEPDVGTPLEDDTNKDTKLFWTLKYYQQFFDVDTFEVLDRLKASVIPKRNHILNQSIKLKPDLYGPFWICVTLIFTIAISGNIANYLQHINVQHHWKYDFHLVSYAATTIVLYVSLIPLLVLVLLKWHSNNENLDTLEEVSVITPLQLICLYGYSLFIYIPVSILWSIQIKWFQWTLVLVAALLSGSVLVNSILPAVKYSRRKFVIILIVVFCHLLLAIGFMLYFFHDPHSSVVNHVEVQVVEQNSTSQKIQVVQ